MTRLYDPGLSLARVQRVRKAAAAGCTFKEIAGYAGVHPNTLREWIRRGEQGQRGYRAILPSIRAAQARTRMKRRKRIEDASAADWRAAAHLDLADEQDIEAEAFEGQTRTELIEWAANHPDVVARVLELERRKQLQPPAPALTEGEPKP